MNNFIITPEAMELAVQTLAENGHLIFRMTRTEDDVFSMGLYKGSLEVLSMPDVKIHKGDIFELIDMKMKLDLKMA